MKIGFLLPANFAVGNRGNGVRAQACFQAGALERLGHEVVRLNPWEYHDLASFDVIQFFQGGFAHHMIGSIRSRYKGLLVFAPIIDTNESNKRYRLAAKLGHLLKKVYTVPGVFQEQARSSDLIICRSQHERNRIVEGVGIPIEKTAIVLNGVEPPISSNAGDLNGNLNLPDDFILHVSAYTQERKNILRLVEAVGPTGYPLVIAGSATSGVVQDKLIHLTQKFRNIRLLGFLDRATLNSLFAACKVFCLPSIHEGTGLVALEAGVHGASVVITRYGGTSDYFANLAEYVDPFDVGSIRCAVIKAWEKPSNSSLKDHILTSLTWDESARALISAYENHLVTL